MIGKPLVGALINRAHPSVRKMYHRWVTNEGAGTKLNDSSGKRSMTTNATWIGGKTGKALRYNGTSQLSSAVTAFGGTTDLTVAFNYYRATLASAVCILCELSADANANSVGTFWVADGYNVATGVSANITSVLVYGATNVGTGARFTQPSAGKVHRIVVVMDRKLTANQITAVYVDGVSQALTYGSTTAALTYATTWASDTMYFMSRGGASLWASGDTDDWTFWGRLFTAQDAKNDYADRYGAWGRRFYSVANAFKAAWARNRSQVIGAGVH